MNSRCCEEGVPKLLMHQRHLKEGFKFGPCSYGQYMITLALDFVQLYSSPFFSQEIQY
jgi:hypothetical protein